MVTCHSQRADGRSPVSTTTKSDLVSKDPWDSVGRPLRCSVLYTSVILSGEVDQIGGLLGAGEVVARF